MTWNKDMFGSWCQTKFKAGLMMSSVNIMDKFWSVADQRKLVPRWSWHFDLMIVIKICVLPVSYSIIFLHRDCGGCFGQFLFAHPALLFHKAEEVPTVLLRCLVFQLYDPLQSHQWMLIERLEYFERNAVHGNTCQFNSPLVAEGQIHNVSNGP